MIISKRVGKVTICKFMDIGGLLCEYAGNIVSTGTGKTEYVTDVTVGSDYSVLYDSIVVSDWFVEVYVDKSLGEYIEVE